VLRFTFIFNSQNNMFIKLAFGLVIGSAAIATHAQTITDIKTQTGHSAYAQDGRNVIVRNPFGLCWRSGYWTPSDAVPGCDGQLAPPVAKITAPPVPALQDTPPAPPIAARPAPKRCDFTATLENDQTFAFNQTSLNDAAMRHIDEEVVRKIGSCTEIENIVVIGHADRLGAPAYNQKLSEGRAEAVTQYLKNRNVAPVIKTVGAGSSAPIKSCDNLRGRQQLIECLAPNRRVTIEVSGTAN
jgi:OOP family OmpA-OmpF porin